MLVHLIQRMFPEVYWSASFIACILVAMALSATLFVITRYKGWLVCIAACIIYLLPFFFYMR